MNAAQRRIARRIVTTSFPIGTAIKNDRDIRAVVKGVTKSATRVVVRMGNNRSAEWSVGSIAVSA